VWIEPSGCRRSLPINVMAEGSETPGGEPPRRIEGDLLAERRARRGADGQDTALTRRAETAEATVRTLETHVTTLQLRLREAEDARRQASERLQAEQIARPADEGSASESELRRVKQREYAEQQLRVEAEERYNELDRESRAEIERLSRRLSASERTARELAERLETVQRELAEAEQAAAAERAAVRRSERELQARLAALERRAVDIHHGLGAERAARELAEQEIASMREGHRRAEAIVGELRGVVSRLKVSAESAPARERPFRQDLEPGPEERPPAARKAPEQARGTEMGEALAAAVERLRARVEDVGEDQEVTAAPGARAAEGRPDQAEEGGQDGAEQAEAPLVGMSPPREALDSPRKMSRWAAWRARRRARKHR